MTQTAAGRADGYTLDLGGWRGKGNFGGGLASGNGLTGLRILSIQPFKRLWGPLAGGQSDFMQLRLLRLFLGFSAFAWGISAVGVFVSWAEADRLLEGLGAKLIPYDPMMDYWLRMAAGAFALVGAWYLLLAIWPRKFRVAIPWFGLLMVLEGVILLVHGLRLSLPPFPFYGDVSACFVGGAGILLSLPGLPEGAGSDPSSQK